MMKHDQQKEPNVIISEPRTQSFLTKSVLLGAPWFVPLDHTISKIGPLYSVMTIAPVTVTIVPTTFARPGALLIFTFSSLEIKRPSQSSSITRRVRPSLYLYVGLGSRNLNLQLNELGICWAN